MRFSTLRSLTGALFFGLAIAALPANPSPGADTELICHTTNPAECYPRIFQPTKDFQIIHDDQDIPPGLHVRMDIYSGKKEARLNIPMEGDAETSDIPTEQAMVIVDQPEQETREESHEDQPVALRDLVHKKPPAYEAAGKILPPREPDGSVADSENFARALNILSSDPAIDRSSALSSLLELSHDIYYGVELMKSTSVLEQLMALMQDQDASSPSAGRRRAAAGILANAVQNNPTALAEAQKSWRLYLADPRMASSTDQVNTADREFVAQTLLALETETDPAAMKAKVHALNGLVKAHEVRDVLLDLKGLEHLLSVFRAQGEAWTPVRMKVAQFVADNFLDEEMGAERGRWPRGVIEADEVCAAGRVGGPTPDGCWVYHVGRYVNENRQGEDDGWSRQFLRLLKKEAEGNGVVGMGQHDRKGEL